MDVLKQLNEAVGYIEANLCEEIDMEELARIACVTQDSFIRFFSYMTGMTLKEYIRRRRLTRAAYDLRDGRLRVIDIAVQYGWSGADSFSKAFVRQHGISPKEARDASKALTVVPPASFYMMIKGAKEMNFRVIETEEIEVFGVSKPFDGQGYQSQEELRNLMWSEECDNVPAQICGGKWNQTSTTQYDGVWYGLWQGGRYGILREKADVKNAGLERQVIPAGTYAVFKTGRGGLAWEEFPKLRELVFDSWLPDSGYRQKGDTVIEVSHLFTDKEMRRKNRYYELWLPVVKAH